MIYFNECGKLIIEEKDLFILVDYTLEGYSKHMYSILRLFSDKKADQKLKQITKQLKEKYNNNVKVYSARVMTANDLFEDLPL